LRTWGVGDGWASCPESEVEAEQLWAWRRELGFMGRVRVCWGWTVEVMRLLVGLWVWVGICMGRRRGGRWLGLGRAALRLGIVWGVGLFGSLGSR
jgi:hypothetical protein